MDARAGRGVQAADPRGLRGAGQPVARDLATVGRRHYRPRPDPRRARPRLRRVPERPDPRARAVRRVPDVKMTVWLFALALQSASGGLPPGQALPPPSGDQPAVLAPIHRLFDALAAGDAAGVLKVVYPDGRVTAVGTLRSGTGLRQESWTQFAARLNPGKGFTETISDPAIEVDDDVAVVWAPFVVRVD